MKTDRLQAGFLLFAAVGLAPIALSYGLMPAVSLPWLFDIDASSINSRHVFRAVMGLYLALCAFWVAAAMKPHLRIPALWSLTVFMFGLALGRVLSIIVDGIPHPLLLAYMAAEFGLGFAGWRILKLSTPAD
jgi:hypothetical protein